MLVRSALLTLLAASSLSLAGCSKDDSNSHAEAGPDDAGPDANEACQNVMQFSPGQEDALQDAVNSLTGCATITLAGGTYTFSNAVTIRADGVTLQGAGKGAKGEGTGGATATVLVFTNAAPNTNGVDVVGNDFAIRDLAIWDAKKDALRIESSENVKIQRVRTEWTTADASTNGKYGLYPVKSKNVLIEECEAYNAADAGIYVGQTEHAIVRNNIAKQNVAGIEIENTQFADVYGNTAEDNTCGLVVFDLPGNPIKGTDILLKNNIVVGNNRANFASVSESSSTVSQVPAGTGTFIMASRRVEVVGNTYKNNDTGDVAVLSGLAIEDNLSAWSPLFNFDSSSIWIHGNDFQGESGDDVDVASASLRPFGALIGGLYQAGFALEMDDGKVEHIVWDGIDGTPGQDDLVNVIGLCAADNTVKAGVTNFIADLNFFAVAPLMLAAEPDAVGAWGKTARYAQNAAPFDCGAFEPALAPVVLP